MRSETAMPTIESTSSERTDLPLAKAFAVACEVAFVTLVVTMAVMVPSAMRSPVPWVLLAIVTGGVLLVHATASAVGRRRSARLGG